jgi:hypothetical protein
MKRHKRKRWAGVYLLGAALGTAGCPAFTLHPFGNPSAEPVPKAPAPSPGGTAGRPARPPAPEAVGLAPGGTPVTPVPAAAVTAAAGSRFQAGPAPAAEPAPMAQRVTGADAGKEGMLRHRPILTFDASGAEDCQAVPAANAPAPVQQVAPLPHPWAPAAAPAAAEPDPMAQRVTGADAGEEDMLRRHPILTFDASGAEDCQAVPAANAPAPVQQVAPLPHPQAPAVAAPAAPAPGPGVTPIAH